MNVSGMSGKPQISIWAWHWWTWNLSCLLSLFRSQTERKGGSKMHFNKKCFCCDAFEFLSHLSSRIAFIAESGNGEMSFHEVRRIIYLWLFNVTIFLWMTLFKSYNYPGIAIASCWNMWRVFSKFSDKILATTSSSTYPRGQTVYCQSFKNIF